MSQIRNCVLPLALLLLLSSSANACSCLTKGSNEQQFRKARTVVLGLVKETRFVPDTTVFGGGYIRALVEVRGTLKGKPGRRLAAIDQIPQGGMCSSFLLAGIEYVLFVDDRSAVGMCSGTWPFVGTVYDRGEKLIELQDLKARAER